MLGAGIVGAGALRLLPNASADAGAGWLHAALYTVDAARLANGSSPSFTLEAWIRVPSACASAEAATSANFSFVLAGSDYAVALRGMQVQQDGANDAVPRVFWPLFFWTAAPPRQCVAGPLVLTSTTGVIGDGPGMLARYVSEGPLSCSWILAPGGGGGGTDRCGGHFLVAGAVECAPCFGCRRGSLVTNSNGIAADFLTPRTSHKFKRGHRQEAGAGGMADHRAV